jgi:hypothetical protein
MCDAGSRGPRIDRRLNPGRHRNCADVSAFADEIRNDPVLLALLERLEPEGQQLTTAQAAANQHGSMA